MRHDSVAARPQIRVEQHPGGALPDCRRRIRQGSFTGRSGRSRNPGLGELGTCWVGTQALAAGQREKPRS
jgi:hypothetical protein